MNICYITTTDMNSAAPGNKGHCIFVIDDDTAISGILVSLLAGESFDVRSFTSGKEAVLGIQIMKPDVVLLDYILPGESCKKIIASLREELGNKVPIVLMSAHLKAAQEAKKMGVSEFLAKPFQLDAVLGAVSRSLN